MIEVSLERDWIPWLEGQIEGREIKTFNREDGTVLSMVLDKQGTRTVGRVIELFKVLEVRESIDSFIETIPRSVLLLASHSSEGTLRFIVFKSEPEYVTVKENFNLKLKEAENRLEKLCSSMQVIAKAYDLKFYPLTKENLKSKEKLFNDLFFLNVFKPAKSLMEETVNDKSGVGKYAGKIIVGVDKSNKLIEEPVQLFNQSTIYSGTENERNHAITLLTESFLLSRTPVMLFDWNDNFNGLNKPSNNSVSLKESQILADPIGFPVKEFEAGKDIKINLNLLPENSLKEVFGFGENNASQMIEQIVKEKKPFKTIKDIIKALEENFKDKDKLFDLKQAVRMLKLIEKQYQGLFEGENNLSEIIKTWMNSMGRLSIINLKNEDKRIQQLIVHSLVSESIKTYSFNENKKLNCMIVVPETQNILNKVPENSLEKSLADNLEKLKEKSIGFILSLDKEISLPKKVNDKAEARIEIISGKDVGIMLMQAKPYRVFLRPSLSKGNN
ncbi:MAG: DUF87 domain-containing protein [archaeon]